MYKDNIEWLNVPNILTIARLVSVPFLVFVAFIGNRAAFYVLFLAMLSTDALDGYLARRLNQVTELGSRLDGWADLAMWSSTLLSVWLLFPAIVKRELFFAVFALCAFVLPMIVGFIKYKKVPIYHCWSAKIQAILMSIAVVLLIFVDVSWFFRIVAISQGIAACEDISITLLLDEPHCDVLSFRHALKLNNKT